MQSFERFRGKYTYYVTDYSDRALDRIAAIREVAKQTKTPKDRYTIVAVWIQRDRAGWDLLWTQDAPQSDRMMAVVRKEAVK
ncbi:MAG: hypothetical protein IKG19_03955 [Lachnospiraceae bacterium]|nr:hypothetical protein [Lachnospiraceae bacterium]